MNIVVPVIITSYFFQSHYHQISASAVFYANHFTSGFMHKEASDLSVHLLVLYRDPSRAKNLLGFLGIAHVFEAMYVAYLIFDKVKSPVKRLQWFLYSFVFGFPVIKNAWNLCAKAKAK